ncbi:MAG: hypothetical protein PVF14_19315 [Desulfobacterales bacterium]
MSKTKMCIWHLSMLHEIIYRRMCLGSYESFCSSAGHEVATVEERRLSGAEDEIVLAQALSENRAFLAVTCIFQIYVSTGQLSRDHCLKNRAVNEGSRASHVD